MTPDGDHFYIMEYLEGRTQPPGLSNERAMDVKRAHNVGPQIAKAPAAAHAAA